MAHVSVVCSLLSPSRKRHIDYAFYGAITCHSPTSNLHIHGLLRLPPIGKIKSRQMLAGRCDTSQVSLQPYPSLAPAFASVSLPLHTIRFYVCTRSNNFIVCKIIANLPSSCAHKSIHLPASPKNRGVGSWEFDCEKRKKKSAQPGIFTGKLLAKSSRPKQLARKQWMSQYFGFWLMALKMDYWPVSINSPVDGEAVGTRCSRSFHQPEVHSI